MSFHSPLIWRTIFPTILLLLINLEGKRLYATTGSSSDDNVMDQAFKCCNFRKASVDLLQCTIDWLGRNQTNKSLQSNNKVTVVTYASNNIIHYAAYPLTINAIYSHLNGYEYRVVSDSDSLEYRTTVDARWNKVHILMEALDSTYGWAKDSNYLVWLDSDLCVLDMSFQIEKQFEAYPQADIIMSKDIITAPFVSNSGTILVRNTPWAQGFLNLWWNSYDRTRCCDQNAFTWLYDRNVPSDIKNRTVLLPADSINTNFPSWRNQLAHNPILHLAGLTSLYRTEIFKLGLENLCNVHEDSLSRKTKSTAPRQETSAPRNVENAGTSPLMSSVMNSLPHQLGLDKDTLFVHMRNLTSMRLAAVDRLCGEVNCDGKKLQGDMQQQQFLGTNVSLNTSISYRDIQYIRSKLEDIMKTDDDEKEYFNVFDQLQWRQLRLRELKIRKWIFWNFHQTTLMSIDVHKEQKRLQANDKNDVDIGIGTFQDSPEQYAQMVEMIKETVSSGFELVIQAKVAYSLKRQVDEAASDHQPTSEGLLVDHGYNLTRNAFEILDQHCQPMIDMILHVTDLPKSVRAVFLYYRFKQYQLLAASYQVGSAISENKPASIHWLTAATEVWKEMTTFNYYGSAYVLADPNKEYSAALSELAMLYCLQNNYSVGLQTFQLSVSVQEGTLDGYSAIRIATNDVIRVGWITLADTYINYGICGVEQVENSLDLHAEHLHTHPHQFENVSRASNPNMERQFYGFLDSATQNIRKGLKLLMAHNSLERNDKRFIVANLFLNRAERILKERHDGNENKDASTTAFISSEAVIVQSSPLHSQTITDGSDTSALDGFQSKRKIKKRLKRGRKK